MFINNLTTTVQMLLAMDMVEIYIKRNPTYILDRLVWGSTYQGMSLSELKEILEDRLPESLKYQRGTTTLIGI